MARTVIWLPKDMTRTASGLLLSARFEGVVMLKPTTHFDQVPLAIVRKIVEEQLLRDQQPALKSTSKEGYAKTNRPEDQTKPTQGPDF